MGFTQPGNLLHSYWKWSSRKFVSFPIKNGGSFHKTFTRNLELFAASVLTHSHMKIVFCNNCSLCRWFCTTKSSRPYISQLLAAGHDLPKGEQDGVNSEGDPHLPVSINSWQKEWIVLQNSLKWFPIGCSSLLTRVAILSPSFCHSGFHTPCRTRKLKICWQKISLKVWFLRMT